MIGDEVEESMVSSLEALSIFGLGAYVGFTSKPDCAFNYPANGSYHMRGQAFLRIVSGLVLFNLHKCVAPTNWLSKRCNLLSNSSVISPIWDK